MNLQEREKLCRDMADAVLLPEDHPTRKQVMRRVQQAGDWAEEHWVELVAINERMRLELPQVTPPAGLTERLLTITTTTQTRRHSSAKRRAFAGAFASMLVIGLLVWQWPAGSGDGVAAAQTVAQLAAADHLRKPVMTVRSSNPDEVATVLDATTALAVRMPDLGEAYRLEGGRICKFDQRQVVYTCWRRDGQTHSLYQFEPEAFGLTRGFSRMQTMIRPSLDSPAQRVEIWSEGPNGYALVCDEHDAPNEDHTKSRS